MSGQRFTVSAEFDTLDEALTLARRLDAEGLAVYVDLGMDDGGDGQGEPEPAPYRPPCDCDQSGSGYSLCRYCFDEQVGGEELGE
jgi:hypothetical protein